MGTRSLTTFIDKWTDEKTSKVKKTKIVTMYRQYDGYPEGHGLELAEFLASGKMVNGIGMEDQRVFNGMGCLAAQCVKDFKDGAGGIYLHRGGTINCWEEYRYEVIFDHDTKKLTMRCIDIGYKTKNKVLFDGEPADFITKYKKEGVTA